MPFTSTGLVIGAFTHVSWAAFALGAAGGLLDGVARSDRLRHTVFLIAITSGGAAAAALTSSIA